MTEHKKPAASKSQKEAPAVEQAGNTPPEAATQTICGLIMPIAANEVGTAEHWAQVRRMITDSLNNTGLKVQMVSESDEVNVIHKNIVLNIYSNDIVICDVSSRNPNVMFELGMRLTFDKPVVIIKDKETPFSFDVGNIQHLEYPRSLNYVEILSFQKELREKTLSTLEASRSGAYSPFLSNYKIREVSKIETEVVNRDDYILGAIKELRQEIREANTKNVLIKTGKYDDDYINKVSYNRHHVTIKSPQNVVNETVAAILNSGFPVVHEEDVVDRCLTILMERFPNSSDQWRMAIAEQVADRLVPF